MASIADSRLSVMIKGTKQELEAWQRHLTEGLQALGAQVNCRIASGTDAKGTREFTRRGKLQSRRTGKRRTGRNSKATSAGKVTTKGKEQSQKTSGPPLQRRGKKRHAARAGQEKEQRFEGVVKSFNEKRGYFFVDCPEIYGTYKCDVVLRDGDCPNAQTGSTIQFSAVEAAGYKNPVAQTVRLVA